MDCLLHKPLDWNGSFYSLVLQQFRNRISLWLRLIQVKLNIKQGSLKPIFFNFAAGSPRCSTLFCFVVLLFNTFEKKCIHIDKNDIANIKNSRTSYHVAISYVKLCLKLSLSYDVTWVYITVVIRRILWDNLWVGYSIWQTLLSRRKAVSFNTSLPVMARGLLHR